MLVLDILDVEGQDAFKSRSACFSSATCALQTFLKVGNLVEKAVFSRRPGTQLASNSGFVCGGILSI